MTSQRRVSALRLNNVRTYELHVDVPSRTTRATCLETGETAIDGFEPLTPAEEDGIRAFLGSSIDSATNSVPDAGGLEYTAGRISDSVLGRIIFPGEVQELVGREHAVDGSLRIIVNEDSDYSWLPWEIVKAPGTQAVSIVRNCRSESIGAVEAESIDNVVVVQLGSDPDAATGAEVAFRALQGPLEVAVSFLEAISLDDLERLEPDGRTAVVLVGHGYNDRGGSVVMFDGGQEATGQQLLDTPLSNAGLVVLGSCRSAASGAADMSLAATIAKEVPAVVGMVDGTDFEEVKRVIAALNDHGFDVVSAVAQFQSNASLALRARIRLYSTSQSITLRRRKVDTFGGQFSTIATIRESYPPENYYPRIGAIERVRYWLESETPSVLVFTGDKGAGKTGLALGLIEAHLDGGLFPPSWPLAACFLQGKKANDSDLDPDMVYRTIRDQLHAAVPSQQAWRLPKSGTASQDVAVIREGLLDPIQHLFGGALLVFDGLDEAQDETLKFVEAVAQASVSSAVKVIMTSRPFEKVPTYSAAVESLSGLLTHNDGSTDAQDWLSRRLLDSPPARLRELSVQKDRIGSSFLIADRVAEKALAHPDDELSVPDSLEQLFADEVRRIDKLANQEGYPGEHTRRAIEILSIQTEPMGRVTLRELLRGEGLERPEIDRAIKAIEPFVTAGYLAQGSYQLFDSELAEEIQWRSGSDWWEGNDPNTGGKRAAAVGRLHERIVNHLEAYISDPDSEEFWIGVDENCPYLRRSVVTHLSKAADLGALTAQQKLNKLVGDLEFFAHRMAYDGRRALVSDLRVAAASGVETVSLAWR